MELVVCFPNAVQWVLALTAVRFTLSLSSNSRPNIFLFYILFFLLFLGGKVDCNTCFFLHEKLKKELLLKQNLKSLGPKSGFKLSVEGGVCRPHTGFKLPYHTQGTPHKRREHTVDVHSVILLASGSIYCSLSQSCIRPVIANAKWTLPAAAASQ